VHETSVSSTSIALAWTASTDNVGVTGYNVYNLVNNTPAKIGASNGAAPSAQLNGLTPNTAYHLQVTALDANKNESGKSAVRDVSTPPGGCTQPVCAADQVGTDDDVVWGLVTLPDGTILFNERDAHTIVHLNPSTGAKKTIGTCPTCRAPTARAA